MLRFMKPNVDFEGGVNGFDKLEVCRHGGGLSVEQD